jgi:hypothetical protein
LIDLNVIEIIAAYLAGWHINAADLKPIDRRRFRWKQDTLNVPRDFEIVIESLLFVSHGINDGVVKRKGGLLSDRLKNDEIAL